MALKSALNFYIEPTVEEYHFDVIHTLRHECVSKGPTGVLLKIHWTPGLKILTTK